jgi:uncharacterized protein (TIGR03437 family)
LIENAGVDYLLPYWMGRYYGVIGNGSAIQSSAAPGNAVAPGSLASVYSANLAAAVKQAEVLPLPLSLGGVTLSITDSSGAMLTAPLLYVSPGQVNFLLPDNVATGVATFTVAGAQWQSFTAAVQRVAPALFSMNGTGTGVAAATAVAIQAGNPQLQSPVPVFQCGTSGCVPTPIPIAIDRPVAVTFYGTGIRNRSSLDNVIVTINGIHLPAQYAGATPNFAGLDQVNVALPLLVRGSGEVNVSLLVDGQLSNTVTIQVQ